MVSMTIDQALALQPGTQLRFGTNPLAFEVLGIEARGKGVYIALRREDGHLTHATEHDLHHMEIVLAPADVEDTPEDAPVDVNKTKRKRRTGDA